MTPFHACFFGRVILFMIGLWTLIFHCQISWQVLPSGNHLALSRKLLTFSFRLQQGNWKQRTCHHPLTLKWEDQPANLRRSTSDRVCMNIWFGFGYKRLGQGTDRESAFMPWHKLWTRPKALYTSISYIHSVFYILIKRMRRLAM